MGGGTVEREGREPTKPFANPVLIPSFVVRAR